MIDIVVRLIQSKTSHHGVVYPLPYFETGLMPLNSLRYHDFEYPMEKGRNVFRIIVVGDSFSEGGDLSFEDSYPKKLECYLNYFGNDKRVTYQVINMSMGGRSTPPEVRGIKHDAGELKPDLIVLGYCLNDPEDWEEGRDYLSKLRDKCYYRSFTKPEGWTSFFYDHSALVRLVMDRLFNSRVKRGHIQYFHKLYRDTYSGWQKAKTALFDLGDFSRATHIPVRVVIFPLTTYGLGDDYPFTDIHEKLHSVLEKAGLQYVDLFPLFKYMDHILLEHVPYTDPHPSEIANRMAAEALWQDLMRSGLLPAELKLGERLFSYPCTPIFGR